MVVIFIFIALTIFLFGLYQWAKGGSILWQIFNIRKSEKGLKKSEKKILEDEVQRLEQDTDRTLRTSFRLMGFLAVFLWLLFGATIVLDMMGIDWIGRLTTRAQQYWALSAENSNINTQSRNNVLRNMGNSLRK